LAEFNAFYDVRVKELPDSLAKVHQSTAWNEVMNEAQRVLTDLRRPVGG